MQIGDFMWFIARICKIVSLASMFVFSPAFFGIYSVQAYIIDDFQTGMISPPTDYYGVGFYVETRSGLGILGDERRVVSTITHVDNNSAISGVHLGVDGGVLSFGTDEGVHSSLSLSWAGVGNLGFDPFFDATQSGQQAGLQFTAFSDRPGIQFNLSICSSDRDCFLYVFLTQQAGEQVFSLLFDQVVDEVQNDGARLDEVSMFRLDVFSPDDVTGFDVSLKEISSIPFAAEVPESSFSFLFILGFLMFFILYNRMKILTAQ